MTRCACALELFSQIQFTETDPTLSNDYYTAGRPDASPAGKYVIVQLVPAGGGPTQLGSYVVDAQGNISTTNTSSDMPSSAFVRPGMKFSPSGDLLVAYANGIESNGKSGIEIHNFNGAAPLTLNRTLLTGTPVDDVAWDGSNHLYAISKSHNRLYVFTVTSTSATEDSSYAISTPVSVVVVSQSTACPAPASNAVNVCSPTNGSTVASPVQLNAAATLTGGVYRFEVWSGSTKLASVSNSSDLNQSISLAAGSYHLIFSARNAAGTHQYATRDITVK